MTSEFDFIKNLRSLAYPATSVQQQALNFEDDICIISQSNDQVIIASKDVITENTHFFENDPLKYVVKKAIRTNISDITAKGAKIYGMMVGLLLPEKYRDTASLQLIQKALEEDIAYYDIPFLGGDTVSSQTFSISITIFGACPKVPPLRSNAQINDSIYVTGVLGKSHTGLQLRQGKLKETDFNKRYLNNYLLPDPPYWMGQALFPYMHAACDISDGLLADLEHILTASHVGAIIDPALIPCAHAVHDAFINQQYALTGGDDYQILFTSRHSHQEIQDIADAHNIPITQIGTIKKETGLRLLTNHTINKKGYNNF